MAIGPPLAGKGTNPPIDTMHKGVRQGGNKSTKSYRSDIGIPGYTGFCPAFAALPPPIKGGTERLGKSVDRATLATEPVGDPRYTTHYTETMRAPDPELYQKAHQTLQETAKLRETAVNIQPGGYANQASVYRSTIGVDTTRNAPASGGCSQSRSADPAAAHAAFVFSTAYSRMSVKDAPGAERIVSSTGRDQFGRPSDTGRGASAAAPKAVRPNKVQSVGHERNGTHYTEVYGAPGWNPLTESTRISDAHTTHSSTSSLDKGTVRGTAHVPGYSGHVPKIGGESLEPRGSSTKDTLMYDLAQFSQGRVPFYSGFKPKAASNMRTPQKPTPQTTQGYANTSVRMLIEKRGGVLSMQPRAGAAARP